MTHSRKSRRRVHRKPSAEGIGSRRDVDGNQMRVSSIGWYNLDDLRVEFGETRARVRNWVQRGLFGRWVARAGKIRIPQKAVIRFICYHPAEYKLMKVDQTWLRALLFAEVVRSARKREG